MGSEADDVKLLHSTWFWCAVVVLAGLAIMALPFLLDWLLRVLGAA